MSKQLSKFNKADEEAVKQMQREEAEEEAQTEKKQYVRTKEDIEEEKRIAAEAEKNAKNYQKPNSLRGEKVKMKDCLDQEIILTEFKILDSDFEETDKYILFQFSREGKLYVTTTSSGVLMSQFEKNAENLPLRCKIVKPKGKKYYTLRELEEA